MSGLLVEISQIKVGPRFGPPNSRQIQLLADSISEVGLLNPITIDSEHNLIAGLHRLKAVKQLGWDSIECVVRDVPLIQAAMSEIDDDLLHKRLTGIDLGDFLLRRKELYEMLYPETRHGGDRKSRTWNENYEAKNSKTHRKKSFAESLFSILPDRCNRGMIQKNKKERGMTDEEDLSKRYNAGTV